MNPIIKSLKDASDSAELYILALEAKVEELATALMRRPPEGDLILVNKGSNTCCFFGKDTTHEYALDYAVKSLNWHKNTSLVIATRVEAEYSVTPTFTVRPV